MKNSIHNYSDIINIKRPVFTKHKKMSLKDRAAQFAPFAALTGHKAAVDEKARLTEDKKILDDNKKELIDRVLNQVNDKKVKLEYYVNDELKSGGKYIRIETKIKNIDLYNRKIELENNTKIDIEDIYDIEILNNRIKV